MNSDNTISIRSSFSIENILSKPHKNASADNQCKSESASVCPENNNVDKMTSFANQDIILKSEPVNALSDAHLNPNDDFTINNRNNFTSPDSSGCEEDNVDSLSDITTEENRKDFNYSP